MLVAFFIIVVHFIADFVLQTHWQATNKSKNNVALLLHTISYSAFFLFVGIMLPHLFTVEQVIAFTFITFFAHTVTDYITSRINTWLWNRKDVHNFFVSVGFDQVLHYAQLFLTYHYLQNLKL